MTTLLARSVAKINLDLRILGRREDGYHEIKTTFQAIDLADEIVFEKSADLSLSVTGPHAVPADQSNLVMKAARAMSARYPGRGARILLRKKIPAGAGLGGGSSNAAVTLLALSRLWGVDPDPGLLDSMARLLGADVPFFLYGGTCMGLGRGDEIAPLPDAPARHVAVLWPRRGLSTRHVYEALGASLTNVRIPSSMKGFLPGTPTREATAAGPAPGREPFLEPVNDLEETAFGMMPELASLKDRLAAAGALGAAMSGSGSALYGLYPVEQSLAGLAASLATAEAEVITCRTLTRDAYRLGMFERSRT